MSQPHIDYVFIALFYDKANAEQISPYVYQKSKLYGILKRILDTDSNVNNADNGNNDKGNECCVLQIRTRVRSTINIWLTKIYDNKVQTKTHDMLLGTKC